MENQLRKRITEMYKERKGALDWSALMDYANLVIGLREEIEEQLPKQPFNKEAADQAVEKQVPYLSLDPVVIDAAQFRDACKGLFEEFVETGVLSAENAAVLKDVDWNLLTNETVALAGRDPEKFFLEASRELLKNDENEIAPVVLAGILVNVLRAYLNGTGQEMTAFLNEKDDGIIFKNFSMTCPTCGQVPTLASVTEGEDRQGGARRLFCSCCGTVWHFERLRCAHCGNRNTNEMEYVSADEDPGHRLHLCKKCGGVMPTVFTQALGIAVDFDIEQTACSVIQTLYAEDETRAKVEKDE